MEISYLKTITETFLAVGNFGGDQTMSFQNNYLGGGANNTGISFAGNGLSVNGLPNGLIALPNPNAEQWYFVTFTVGLINGNTQTQFISYINGVQTNALTTAVPANPIYAAPVAVTIGCRHTNNSRQFFNGTIDDVRIYNRALTPCEIAILYRQNPATQTTPIDIATLATSPITASGEAAPNTIINYSVTPKFNPCIIIPDQSPMPTISINWTVPEGASILSGQGTPNISVSYGSSFQGGSVTATESVLNCNIPSSTILYLADFQVNDVAVCYNNSATLTASGASQYRWYDAQTGGNLVFTGNPYVTSNLTQNTDFYVSTFVGNQESIRKKVIATVFALPEVILTAPSIVELNEKFSISLNVSQGNPPYTYFWNLGDAPVFQTNTPTIEHTYQDDGIYTIEVEVVDAKGCKKTISHTIETFFDLLIPNAFTPNQDSKNDFFTISNINGTLYSGKKLFKMKIYNRWGKEIFETNNALTGWNGDNYVSGEYYYEIQFGTKNYKGWVNLLR